MASPITSPTFLLPSPYSLNDKKFISILRPFRIAPIFFRLIYPRIYNLPRREGGLKGIEKKERKRKRERENTKNVLESSILFSRGAIDRERKREKRKEEKKEKEGKKKR